MPSAPCRESKVNKYLPFPHRYWYRCHFWPNVSKRIRSIWDESSPSSPLKKISRKISGPQSANPPKSCPSLAHGFQGQGAIHVWFHSKLRPRLPNLLDVWQMSNSSGAILVRHKKNRLEFWKESWRIPPNNLSNSWLFNTHKTHKKTNKNSWTWNH